MKIIISNRNLRHPNVLQVIYLQFIFFKIKNLLVFGYL